MTTSQRIVRKSLAGEEDILFGEDTQTQTRNGVDYTITKVRNIRPVNSLAELNALDTTRFVKAALFDSALDNVEFYSYNAGSGLWEKARNNFADAVRPMTVAEFKGSTELYDGMELELIDRAGARFIVSAGVVGANGEDVIANTDATFKAILRNSVDTVATAAGCVGDGAQESSSVQNAIDLAVNTHFPAGTYAVNEQIEIADATTVRGSGAYSTGGTWFHQLTTSVITFLVTASKVVMKNLSIRPATGSGTTTAAIQLNEVPNCLLDRVNVTRESGSSRFTDSIDFYSAVSSNLRDVIATNASAYNLRVRNDATAAYPSNAVNDFGGYYAGAGTANIQVLDSDGFQKFGGVVEALSGTGIGVSIENSDNSGLYGPWLENTTRNINVTGSDYFKVFGGNLGDSGIRIQTGCNNNALYSVNVPADLLIDSGATNTTLWACGIPATYTDSGTKTNYTLCNVASLGLKSSWNKLLNAKLEQGSGDTFRLWRSDFAKFEIMRDAAGQDGYLFQDTSTDLIIYKVVAGTSTEILRFDLSTGAWRMLGIPTSSAGLTTGSLWSNAGVVTIV